VDLYSANTLQNPQRAYTKPYNWPTKNTFRSKHHLALLHQTRHMHWLQRRRDCDSTVVRSWVLGAGSRWVGKDGKW